MSSGFWKRTHQVQSPGEALQPQPAPPRPPLPPKKRRSVFSTFSGVLSFFLLIPIIVIGLLSFGWQQLSLPGPLTSDKVVIIAPTKDVSEIFLQLEEEGVIAHAFWSHIAVWMEGNRGRVKAGEYLFRAAISAQDVIDMLVQGKQVLHSLTIPEGWTSEQILDRVKQTDLLSGEVTEPVKEGVFLPETYKFTRNFSRPDLLKKMKEDQKHLLEQIWAHRASDVTLTTPFELVILASIVEKETGKADERPRIARVFLNRLGHHMRLQSDPTVVYGLVGGKGSLGHSLTQSELSAVTAYNTYLIEGLPPGPIANPGKAALEAVAHPSKTKDLYFVADGTGGHVFAETLEQHNKNVQRWRQIEKEMKESNGTLPSSQEKQEKEELPSPAPSLELPTPQIPIPEIPAPNIPVPDIRAPSLNPNDTQEESSLLPLKRSSLRVSQNHAREIEESPFVFGAFRKGFSPLPYAEGNGRDDVSRLESQGDIRFLLFDWMKMSLPQRFPLFTSFQDQEAEKRRRVSINADILLPTAESSEKDASLEPSEPSESKGIDASEGTKWDPLKNTTWDLNSPHRVSLK